MLHNYQLIHNQLYAVWGDTNGDDGKPLVGEASVSLAQACFPNERLDGDHGHTKDDVVYIAFPGSTKQTVYKHAKWAATNFGDFESSIKDRGDALVEQFFH